MSDGYRVTYLYDGAALDGLQIWQGDNLCLDTTACELPDAALQDIFLTARDYYPADRESDDIPPDHAIIAMYLEHVA
jgi:hypothetical protein